MSGAGCKNDQYLDWFVLAWSKCVVNDDRYRVTKTEIDLHGTMVKIRFVAIHGFN